VLLFDRQGLAHFDSNSLSLRLSDSSCAHASIDRGRDRHRCSLPLDSDRGDELDVDPLRRSDGNIRGDDRVRGAGLSSTILVKADGVEVGTFRAESARASTPILSLCTVTGVTRSACALRRREPYGDARGNPAHLVRDAHSQKGRRLE